MRITTKLSFHSVFTSKENNTDLVLRVVFLDAGFQLHRVMWKEAINYARIYGSQIKYIMQLLNQTVSWL